MKTIIFEILVLRQFTFHNLCAKSISVGLHLVRKSGRREEEWKSGDGKVRGERDKGKSQKNLPDISSTADGSRRLMNKSPEEPQGGKEQRKTLWNWSLC